MSREYGNSESEGDDGIATVKPEGDHQARSTPEKTERTSPAGPNEEGTQRGDDRAGWSADFHVVLDRHIQDGVAYGMRDQLFVVIGRSPT